MELIQMKYFLAVAREESISRAADFLYITQPSLTRQIQNMEKEVGQPLFVRGKKMRLTEAGQLLRRRAEEILALYEKTERELLHPQENVGGDVYLCRYSRFKVRRKSLQNTTFQEKNTTSIFLHHAFPPSIIGSPVSVCLRTISADEMYFLFQSFSTNSFES